MENRAEYLIESYFANDLSAAEVTELKNLAATDPSVAAELAFQQKLAASIPANKLAQSIQNTSWSTAAQASAPAVAIQVSMWPRFAYAAAAVVTLLIAAYLFMMPPSLQTLVADNTGNYPNKMKFKSLGDEVAAVPAEVIRAFGLYDQQKFREAAEALQPIVAANADRMDYRFYYGISLVQSKQYPEAVAALTPLVQSPDERRIPALYYLGLALAGNNDLEGARKNLQEYVNSPEGVTYREQARKVLEGLK